MFFSSHPCCLIHITCLASFLYTLPCLSEKNIFHSCQSSSLILSTYTLLHVRMVSSLRVLMRKDCQLSYSEKKKAFFVIKVGYTVERLQIITYKSNLLKNDIKKRRFENYLISLMVWMNLSRFRVEKWRKKFYLN